MACASCLGVRRSAADAARAVAERDLGRATAAVRETAGHLADKARAEAERVRAFLRRR